MTLVHEDGLKVIIEPNENLKAVSKEVMGINIFDEMEIKQAHLGLPKK